jgi:23S rRNA (adenine2503-C2)-methyltransferase
VTKFIRLAVAKEGLMIGRRSIALSTCGLTDKMRQLADEDVSVMLTVSLHATTDAARSRIMPVNKAHNIKAVTDAARYFFQKTGRRVVFEYILTGENTGRDDACRLSGLLRGMPAHLNLIMLNAARDSDLTACSRAEAEAFRDDLMSLGVTATLRRALGADIEGACGQLRSRFLKKSTSAE